MKKCPYQRKINAINYDNNTELLNYVDTPTFLKQWVNPAIH